MALAAITFAKFTFSPADQLEPILDLAAQKYDLLGSANRPCALLFG